MTPPYVVKDEIGRPIMVLDDETEANGMASRNNRSYCSISQENANRIEEKLVQDGRLRALARQ